MSSENARLGADRGPEDNRSDHVILRIAGWQSRPTVVKLTSAKAHRVSGKKFNSESLSVSRFLLGAAIFEGALFAAAFVLGKVLGVWPTSQLIWSWEGARLGLLATIPMLLLFAASWLTTNRSFRQIREFLRDFLGPILDECGLLDLIGLALLAGVCEEVLFRGLIWQFITTFNPTLAVLVTNVLFGLAHSITPLYAWLAGLIGLYLTALMSLGAEPNLLIPMVAHTVYDFVAFLLVRWDYRRCPQEGDLDHDEETDS